MENVTKSPPKVNPKRFERNCDAARRAGYNLHFRPTTISVNGVSVPRGYFEDCHPIVLVALLDKHIGRPGSREV